VRILIEWTAGTADLAVNAPAQVSGRLLGLTVVRDGPGDGDQERRR
jgi:hypothetical protein